MNEKNIDAKAQRWLESIKPYLHDRDFRIGDRTALLIIDMQEFFLNEKSHAFLPAAKAIVPNIAWLLEAWREKGRTVVFTRHALLSSEKPGIMGRWWGDVVKEGSSDSKIIAELKPRRSELVLRKTRYSAFQGTGLEERLRRLGTRGVLITGVLTHLCCETTAREAFMKDFEVFFAVDSTATQYEEFHLSSLRNLADGFAVPIAAKEVLHEAP